MGKILQDPVMALVWIMQAAAFVAALIRLISLGLPGTYRFFAGYLVLCLNGQISLFMLYGDWAVYIIAWVNIQCFACLMFVSVALEAYAAVAKGIKGFESVRPWLLNLSLGGSLLIAVGSLIIDASHRGWGMILPNALLLYRFVYSIMALFLLIVLGFLRMFQQKPVPNLKIHLYVLCGYSAVFACWYSLTLLKHSSNMRNLSTTALFVSAVLLYVWTYRIRPAGEVKYVPPIMPGELEALEAERVAMHAGLSVLTTGVKKSVQPHQK